MPNWCSNFLTITGEQEELDEFYGRATDNPDGVVQLLETFIPTPPELKVDPMITADGKSIEIMGDEEYEWRCRVWGTKWPEHGLEVHNNKGELAFSFDTAWSPPVAGVKAISQIFPSLEFVMEWSEEGMGFIGASYHKGDREVVLDDNYDIDADPDTGEYLDELAEKIGNIVTEAISLGRASE